jgi:hypothetical protein
MPFCIIFKEIQESSHYIYASNVYNNFEYANMYYVMHMIRESQKIKLEKHMLSLPKSDSLVWKTRLFGFVSKTTKN